MDICIVTYNRKVYLERCLVSIIMTSSLRHKIHVIDDGSNDGTMDLLLEYKERGLIETIIHNTVQQGSAKNFNTIIDSTIDKWFVATSDDMYFHRGWDTEITNVVKEQEDCGIVTFFNWRLFGICEGSVIYNDKLWKSRNTGLGACLIYRELYEKAGKFQIRGDKLMGFFARPFCFRCNKVPIKRNVHYSLRVPYAIHMGEPQCKLNEEKKLLEYAKHRDFHKKGIIS